MLKLFSYVYIDNIDSDVIKLLIFSNFMAFLILLLKQVKCSQNRKINQQPACVNQQQRPLSTTSQDDDILQKSKSIDGCLKYFFRNFFVQAFFFHWHLFFYFISNNNGWLLTINIVSFIFFYYRESKPPFCLHYEKSSPVNIVYRKINWQKPRLHKRLYPIRV